MTVTWSPKPVTTAGDVARPSTVVPGAFRRLQHAIRDHSHARVVALLAAVLALESADLGTIGSVAPQLERAFGINHTQLGVLASASLLVSALTTRYRDLRFLVSFGVQLWMYATPVIYPVSSVPEQFQWIIKLNPLTPVVESFRYAFLGAGTVSLTSLLYSVGCTILVLVVGLLLFHKVEATFMDTV